MDPENQIPPDSHSREIDNSCVSTSADSVNAGTRFSHTHAELNGASTPLSADPTVSSGSRTATESSSASRSDDPATSDSGGLASAALKTENANLRAEILQLVSKLDSVDAKRQALAQKQRDLVESLREAREGRNVASQRAKEANEKVKSTRATYVESREKLVASLNRTRESLQNSSSLWKEASRYYSLFWQGLLADEVVKGDVNLGADTYLCLLPSTVPAAMELRRRYGGRIICDCVENVEVERHSLAPKIHPTTLDMINLGAYGALTTVDGIMTVSNAVEKTLHRFGPPVRLQPNYRRFEVPAPAGKLHEMFQLPTDARVLVATGGIVSGFEAVVDAIKMLPDDIHLVTFAKFSASGYDEKVREYIDRQGLGSRIHLSGFVPYETLSPLLADADAGLIVLDPTNPNHSVSLPNRVFDFTTAALPFVAPNVSEITDYVERFNCGTIIHEVGPDAWASGILSVLSNLQTHRDAIANARSQATWESLDDGLVEFLGNPKSVTLLGFRDLSRYQRFLRVTDSLTQRGVQVNAAFFSKDPQPMENEHANFYHFTERYGRGPGLTPVPKLRDIATDE